MTTTNNVCAHCGQSQVDAAGVEHPMTHIATRGLHSGPEDVASLHLDCLPHDVEQAYRAAGHGPLIDRIKGDTKRPDYAARRRWAQEHASTMARTEGE
jgi:hypothetical protein